MAIPLNEFKTSTAVLLQDGTFSGDSDIIYTTPNGITAIVLMAQVANVDSDTPHQVTMTHYDTQTLVETEVVKNFEIQPNDAAGLLSGKLIVQEGNQIRAFTSAPTGEMKMIFSYLQSLNG